MTEGIIFTAASVMQRLRLADAALAVRRRTLCLHMFLQTEPLHCLVSPSILAFLTS